MTYSPMVSRRHTWIVLAIIGVIAIGGLSGRIFDELWSTKSAELKNELRGVRGMARLDRASHGYEATALQIPELAQSAYCYP